MAKSIKPLYAFGAFCLDPTERLLWHQDEVVPLPPKVFDTLLVLVENRGHLVEKGHLMKSVWPDTFVEEGNLTLNISTLRKVLGEKAKDHHYIETIPKRGYRFIANVEELQEKDTELVLEEHTRKHIITEEKLEVITEEVADSAVKGGKALNAALVIGMVFLLGAIGVALWSRRSIHPARSPVLIRLTNDASLSTDPALSPDGKLLAYASDRSGEGHLDIWVKQIAGGEPLRLTHHEADDRSPAFSPDGSLITFASRRDGGGIYTIPVLGGEERLIAKYGALTSAYGAKPRFSPDGKCIAFQDSDDIYVVSSGGGLAKRVASDFQAAFAPTWAPYGDRLLFLGSPGAVGAADPEVVDDWWVVSLDGKARIRTGAYPLFRQRGFPVNSYRCIVPEIWTPNGKVIFTVPLGDSSNIWQMPLSPKTWQIVGPPQRLTFGAGQEGQPSAGTDDRLVFSSVMSNDDIWTLHLEANEGRVTGQPQRLTKNVSIDWVSDLSADGRKLLYLSDQIGKSHVWVRDLVTGKESQITRTDSGEFGKITADGSEIAYVVGNRESVIYVQPTIGGVPKTVCEDCGIPWQWSPQARSFLYLISGRGKDRGEGVGLFDLGTGERTELLKHPSYDIHWPQFSPDNRWIAFTEVGAGQSRLFVTPFRKNPPFNENEWIPVTSKSDSVEGSRWSPDGNLLYFASDRDGFSCYWAQRLDPATKHPLGSAFPVYHSHRSRQPLSAFTFAIAQDKMVFTQGELTGNIWMTTLGSDK